MYHFPRSVRTIGTELTSLGVFHLNQHIALLNDSHFVRQWQCMYPPTSADIFQEEMLKLATTLFRALISIGRRSFTVTSPAAWNSLSQELRRIPAVSTFNKNTSKLDCFISHILTLRHWFISFIVVNCFYSFNFLHYILRTVFIHLLIRFTASLYKFSLIDWVIDW